MFDGKDISIHAPVWGATDTLKEIATELEKFQSTRPYGARLNDTCRIACFNHLFQSTRPYGARLIGGLKTKAGKNNFNPRARMGRDMQECLLRREKKNFNPRARMGRDSTRIRATIVQAIFQSTRPYGARLC